MSLVTLCEAWFVVLYIMPQKSFLVTPFLPYFQWQMIISDKSLHTIWDMLVDKKITFRAIVLVRKVTCLVHQMPLSMEFFWQALCPAVHIHCSVIDSFLKYFAICFWGRCHCLRDVLTCFVTFFVASLSFGDDLQVMLLDNLSNVLIFLLFTFCGDCWLKVQFSLFSNFVSFSRYVLV